MESRNSQNSNTNNQQIRRTFVIGDEWLYYKFYTGAKTADVLLTEMIKPAAEKLLAAGAIDKWFFIRYADPKIHIRVRFHLVKPPYIFNVVQLMQELARPYIDEDLIWKVQVDSYQREVERYGVDTMELAETLFFHDSRMIVAVLDNLAGDEGEQIRWLFGIRALDTLLDDFRFDMQRKLDLLTILKENFGREFGINKGLRDQLKTKFRNERESIATVLDRSQDEGNEIKLLFDILAEKSKALEPLVEEILDLHQKEQLRPPLNDMMGSYIHMMLNRLFKSKQRVHEMVIYDFMYNHYRSELAKQKYGQQPKKEKKKKKDKQKEENN